MKINRRTTLAAFAALIAGGSGAWLGYRRLYPRPDVTVDRPGLPFGHILRDKAALPAASRTHTCNTLILGSGGCALSAAWQLARQGHRDVLIAQGPEKFGNCAAYGRDELTAPTGAHYLALPSQESSDVIQLLDDLGIRRHGVYQEEDLVHAPAERLLYRGSWQEGLLPQEDADSRRFAALIQRLKTARGSDGRKIFAIPVTESSQDNPWRQLDQLTFAAWLNRENYRSPELLWYLDYCCRDDYGQGIAHVSAFAGLHYFAARGHDHDAVLTWPDGLARLCERLSAHIGVQTLAVPPPHAAWQFSSPALINASALQIDEQDDHVDVLLYHHPDRRTLRIRARHVISALPLHIARHIVVRPEHYGLHDTLPQTSAWIIGNFLCAPLPPERDDSALAWDNVIYPSPALGYIYAGHQHIRLAKPEHSLFTTYHALPHDNPSAARHWLQSAGEDELLAHAAQDLVNAYGKRIWRHIKSVHLTLRGHAMSIPHPGYLDRLATLRAHHSRLTFAHTDMSGYSVFEEAVYWGAQAARKRLSAQT